MSGIVDEDIERAGKGERGVQRFRVGHVCDHVGARIARLDGLAQRRLAAAEHRDMGALPAQAARDGPADAAPAAGDEGALAGKRQVGG